MNFDKYQTKGAYHWTWLQTEPWYKACVDKILKFCKGSTLDLGCGEAVIGSLLLERGIKDYVGIDSDKTALQLADPELDVRQGNIEQDSFMGEWDYLVCLNTIEHLKTPKRVVDIFNSSIKKAGIIITDIPQEQPSKYHVKEFTPKELADLFKDFKVVPFQIDENFHGIEVYKK